MPNKGLIDNPASAGGRILEQSRFQQNMGNCGGYLGQNLHHVRSPENNRNSSLIIPIDQKVKNSLSFCINTTNAENEVSRIVLFDHLNFHKTIKGLPATLPNGVVVSLNNFKGDTARLALVMSTFNRFTYKFWRLRIKAQKREQFDQSMTLFEYNHDTTPAQESPFNMADAEPNDYLDTTRHQLTLEDPIYVNDLTAIEIDVLKDQVLVYTFDIDGIYNYY